MTAICYCIAGAFREAAGLTFGGVEPGIRQKEAAVDAVHTAFIAMFGRSPIGYNDITLKDRKTTFSHVKALRKLADSL